MIPLLGQAKVQKHKGKILVKGQAKVKRSTKLYWAEQNQTPGNKIRVSNQNIKPRGLKALQSDTRKLERFTPKQVHEHLFKLLIISH